MATQHVRISSQKTLSYVPHISALGEVWTCVANGTATSAGAAGGTTVIDTNADSGGADTYNGRYWVRCTTGANKDQWKRIVDDDGSGTLTLENNGFPAQVASGVEYEIWQSPEPVVVVDSSSGETNMVDAVISGPGNDFFNGYYAVPITGTHRGKIAQITDYVSSSGTFTLAASFGSALTAGDVVLIRRFIDVSDDAFSPTREYVEARQNRANMMLPDGIVTVRGGTFGFSTDIQGSNSLNASAGNRQGQSAIAGLLPACGYVEPVDLYSVQINTGSTTTAIVVDGASWDSLRIGCGVMYNGHLRFVTALADNGATDTVTVSPALPVAPVSGEVLHAARIYEQTTDGDVLGCTLEYEVDGERITMTGCKGNLSLSDGPRINAAFEFNIDHWVREIEAAPYNANSAYDTTEAIKGDDRRAWINASGVDIKDWTASLNAETTGRMVQGATGINGRKGYQLTSYAPGMTFQELLDVSGDLDQDERFGARTSLDVIVTHGSHGNAIGVRLPAARIIADPATVDSDGLRAAPSVMAGQDPGIYTNPDSSLTQISPLAIAIM